MNLHWSQQILVHLHSEGVRDIVFCPGARNSPLIIALTKTSGFVKHSFFEERAAAFYAMGIARRTGQPVVIITTSGTAAAELLPATVEAFHSGVPLILLTADRPRRLRGTGAPQAIDQTGLFAKFVGREFDLVDRELPDLSSWNRRVPVHINICFDEPLVDEPIESLEIPPRTALASFAGTSPFTVSAGIEWAILRLNKFLRAGPQPVFVGGTLETEDERDATVTPVFFVLVECRRCEFGVISMNLNLK
jgi:2-succinyl-5-enolpyruvyl-6-hydroxy-3-cyclohexene-1-carboxylate synthase